MRSIILFDDLQLERDAILSGLTKTLGAAAKVVPFEAETAPTEGDSYERHISKWIEENLATDSIGLIACDKELGRYKSMPGLSATAVAAVARERGIPCCQYSRQAKDDKRDFARFERLRRWSSEEISLDGFEVAPWVAQIAALFAGFETIRDAYPKVAVAKTPAAALAAILGHPEAESRIALYGSGDQGFLIETLALYEGGQKPDPVQVHMRMTRVLGNWLYLSILRFPGILVDQGAAASYLNIAPVSFNNTNLQSLFNSALYDGPFAKLGPWWWRNTLDEILEKDECQDGLALVKKHGLTAEPCLDPVTGKPAGLYCMITRTPVSSENSRGGISWFPSGADLARIRKDKFDEITALVGMY